MPAGERVGLHLQQRQSRTVSSCFFRAECSAPVCQRMRTTEAGERRVSHPSRSKAGTASSSTG